MIEIRVPQTEAWDETNECFIVLPEETVKMEHSLISIAKWESRWHEPFMGDSDKTDEQILDYMRCMVMGNKDPDVVYRFTMEDSERIGEYINDPMTATTFTDLERKALRGETVTAELIYYWMISLKIPIEFQKWHFNRLMTLIRVCLIKNQPEKKMGRSELLARNKALNDARRKRLNSKG